MLKLSNFHLMLIQKNIIHFDRLHLRKFFDTVYGYLGFKTRSVKTVCP